MRGRIDANAVPLLVFGPPRNLESVPTSDGQKTMTLLSMNVSPLGVWWKYRLEGDDPWPRVRIAMRMKDGAEIEADPVQDQD